jgi:p-hydroxybenzoate 3-monooxygenase
MKTQVVIVGAGPAGLLLSQLLNRAGIATAIIERQPMEHVLKRIRAGVLEWGTTEILREAGIGERMDREGLVHEGIFLAAQNRRFRVDFREACGKQVMVYGQTEVTRDLHDAQTQWQTLILDGSSHVEIHALDTEKPYVTCRHDGTPMRIDCEFVAGCDGFHGISRQAIPQTVRREYERVYPFGWLGVLSHTRPACEELVYANHERGFALASMRSHSLSRYYIQVPAGEDAGAWSDNAFWDELRRRLPDEIAEGIETGPAIEKSIAPLRSFVSEPMRHGQLFLCGDASHIVPPTGAKGLNLAVSDVHYLSQALIRHYRGGGSQGLDEYSSLALSRVWKAIRFSWWMTGLLHRFPEQGDFEQRIQETEIDYVAVSHAARTALAENYTGLPF